MDQGFSPPKPWRTGAYGATKVHVAVCDTPPDVTVTVPLTRVPGAGMGLMAKVEISCPRLLARAMFVKIGPREAASVAAA